MNVANLAIGLLLVPGLGAQALNEHCASINDTDISGFSREGGAGVTVGYVAVIPEEQFRAWGDSNDAPGFHRINGLRIALGDTDSSTTEDVEIWFYQESPTDPNRPDFSQPLGGYTFALFGNGTAGQAEAAIFDLTFPAPVDVVADGDVFIEIYMRGAESPTAAVGVLFGDTRPGLNFDVCNGRGLGLGHGLGVGGYTLIYNYDTQQAFFQESQTLVAPLCADVPGMAAAVRTSQPSLPGSLSPSQSASWFSGLFPVATADRTGALRQDNVGWIWNDGDLPNAQVVGKFSTTGFGTPLQLNGILPGASGSLCLSLAGGPILNYGMATSDGVGRAEWSIDVPFAARASLTGLEIVFQGFVLDLVGDPATIHASNCVKQTW